MQIREIQINGFGIFRDKRLSGISSGLNIIYGSNEFGKTTLLEFIRRILFGFPDKKTRENQYPVSIGGTANGGSLICEMSDGELVTVSRAPGTHGGPLTVKTGSGELRDDTAVKRMFGGNVTRNFYYSIYAIGLNELAAADVLEQDDIREHMYSASLGLGNITLAQIRDRFTETADKLYKPAGKAQQIASLIKEITSMSEGVSTAEQAVADYDRCVEERKVLEDERAELNKRIEELRQESQKLEKWKALFPRFVDMVNAQRDLSGLPETGDFQPDALAKLENYQKRVTQVKGQLVEAENRLRETEGLCNSLEYDEKLLSQEANITRLQRTSELYRSAANDIDLVIHQAKECENAIGKETSRMGPAWTQESIRGFNLSYLSQDMINSFKRSFSEISDKVKRQEIKLETHRESRAMKASNAVRSPVMFMYVSLTLSLLGLLGIAAGMAYSNYLVTILGGLVLIGGLAMVVAYFNNRPGQAADALEQNYQQELNAARAEEDSMTLRWQDVLRSICFPIGLTPDGAEDLGTKIVYAQSKINELDQLNERIGSMRQTIDSTYELRSTIASQLDKIPLSGGIEADIEILMRKLEEVKNSKQQIQNLRQSIQQQQQSIEALKLDCQTAELELSSYLAAHSVVDASDFKAKFDIWERRQQLSRTAGEVMRNIQAFSGVGEQYSRFIDAMEATTALDIDSQLAGAESKLSQLNEERDGKIRKAGELDNEIKGMITGDELLAQREGLELNKQKLHELSREWAQAQAALFILDKAVAKYEETRQPAVISAASQIFKRITAGAYSSIAKPLDSDEFIIRQSDNTSKTIGQLSRGTAEQLLLALRLGLIEVYEAGNEPLPIIMDDILVNFDDSRGARAVEALVEFARTRQIIILTCHENALNSYLSAGARRIYLT